jgi:hypothetical protein
MGRPLLPCPMIEAAPGRLGLAAMADAVTDMRNQSSEDYLGPLIDRNKASIETRFSDLESSLSLLW